MSGPTRLRLATRNLYKGGPPGYTALAKTLAGLSPDILFTQECYEPSRYPGHAYASVWHPTRLGGWGSAIMVDATLPIHADPVPLPGFEGWIVKARILALGLDIDLYSLHTPTVKNRSYTVVALGMLRALAPALAGRNVILGGDWNLTLSEPFLQADHATVPQESALVRAYLTKELGLVNAWRHHHPQRALDRTLRYQFKADSRPFHIDGFMVSPSLVPHIQSCHILEDDIWLDSDHNPVVLEMNL